MGSSQLSTSRGPLVNDHWICKGSLLISGIMALFLISQSKQLQYVFFYSNALILILFRCGHWCMCGCSGPPLTLLNTCIVSFTPSVLTCKIGARKTPERGWIIDKGFIPGVLAVYCDTNGRRHQHTPSTSD